MGINLTIARPPLNVAVDALTRRMDLGVLRWYIELLEPYSGIEYLKATTSKGVPGGGSSEPIRVVGLWRGFGSALDVLTSTAHDRHHWIDIFAAEEFADPVLWAVYGARIVGWPPEDYPLRYSLPSDAEAICAALDVLTDAELRTRVDSVLAQRPGYEGDQEPWLHVQVAGRLAALRSLYGAAAAEGEIVLYLMG